MRKTPSAVPSRSRPAIYPGSFDPLTNGHVDIIQRGALIFDRLIVGVLVNAGKQPRFSVSERVAMAREVFAGHASIEVESFDGLLVDFARARDARLIVRGLRGVADFDAEQQLALMNRHLNADIETVFMMPSEQYTYVSSRLVKEIAGLGGPLKGLVPPVVEARLTGLRPSSRSQRV